MTKAENGNNGSGAPPGITVPGSRGCPEGSDHGSDLAAGAGGSAGFSYQPDTAWDVCTGAATDQRHRQCLEGGADAVEWKDLLGER